MKDKKSLIIYFSRADENYAVGYIDKGNTEVVAEYVQELTNADMFKVEPLVSYSKDYQTCIEEAKKRVGNAPVKESLNDASEYEVIYIMTPIYWGTYAPELETVLKEIDSNAPRDIVLCLLGNKADLTYDRIIQYEDAKEIAGDNLYYEISSKTGNNVSLAFEQLTYEIIEKQNEEKDNPDKVLRGKEGSRTADLNDINEMNRDLFGKKK